MELRHLRCFVAVAEMENVSRAATQKLYVSHPSLSRQIRDLEEELGVQLLERRPKSVCLTEIGRAFLEKAHAILKDTDDAVATVRTLAGKRETELHIGDFPHGTARMMRCLLRQFQKEKIAGVREGSIASSNHHSISSVFGNAANYRSQNCALRVTCSAD